MGGVESGGAADKKSGRQPLFADDAGLEYTCEDVHEDALGRVVNKTHLWVSDRNAKPQITSSYMEWSMPASSEGLYLSASQAMDSDRPQEEPRRIDIHFVIGSSRMEEARIELQRLSAARNECCSDGREIMFASPFLRPNRQTRTSGWEIVAPARFDELRILMGESELLVTLLRKGPGARSDRVVGKARITSEMLMRPKRALAAARTRMDEKLSDYQESCEKMPPTEPIIVAALDNIGPG